MELCSIYLFYLAFSLNSICVSSVEPSELVKVFGIKYKECLTSPIKKKPDIPVGEKCSVKFTQFLNCFPETKKNTVIFEPCTSWLFHESGRIKARCNENSTWDKIDTIRYCETLPPELLAVRRDQFLLKHNLSTEKENRRKAMTFKHLNRVELIKNVLQCLDLIICFISFMLLLLLINFSNARVMLHRNLILSFLAVDILKIMYWAKYDGLNYQNECTVVFVGKQYFFLAQVCWMFNEGFFQFRQFFFVFVRKPYIWRYFIFGWTFPAIVTFGIYVPMMLILPQKSNLILKGCWEGYRDYEVNFVINVPVFLLITSNMVIVTYLMWMIWSKLKSSNSNELQKARKAARGFLVLMVLLGGGYAFTLFGPKDCIEFSYFRAFVGETQGIWVCVAHVILSREVREAIETKYRLFKIEIWVSKRPSLTDGKLSHNNNGINRSGSNLVLATDVIPNANKKSTGSKENGVIVFDQSGSTSKSGIDQNHSDQFFVVVDKAFQAMNKEKFREQEEIEVRKE